jgi:phosphoribosyl 1,2-cyclic phosphodiesterase
MGLRITVLASGSSGNATLVESENGSLLIDAGIGPRILASRLTDAGASWSQLRAVLLTHTHSDHWDDGTLSQLCRREIPLYCSPAHHTVLESWSPGFKQLKSANLVRDYDTASVIESGSGLRCLPVPLRHDGGPTFGFRIEAAADLFGASCRIAYAADLGCWDASLAASLADVELLALEFNHDVALECASRRSPSLIARVLGDEGHLSNDQAAGLLREVVRLSPPGRLQHLVLLHLSRECNRPALALEAAQNILRELSPQVDIQQPDSEEGGVSMWGNRFLIVSVHILALLIVPVLAVAQQRASETSEGQRGIEETAADSLVKELIEAKENDFKTVLDKFKVSKGDRFTYALAIAIPRLIGERREEARDALAGRLLRLKVTLLRDYITDKLPEIRRAAMTASAARIPPIREHIPLIIDRLNDGDPSVSNASAEVLKYMTKENYGPAPGATREERNKAIKAWKEWWVKQGKK